MKIKRTLKFVLIAVAFTTMVTSCSQSTKNETTTNSENIKTNQMELNENKKLVKEFIVAMQNSNVDELKTMITNDFSWWII